MAKKKKWKSVKDIQHIIDNVRDLLEAKEYEGLKENEKAAEYYKKSYDEWKKSGNLIEIREILKQIIAFYTNTGDSVKTRQYEKELKKIKSGKI